MRYIVNAIAIILVIAIVIGVIQYRKNSSTYPFEDSFKKAYKNFGKALQAKEEEIIVSFSPERKWPLTFITKETALRELVPEVFSTFSEQDWGYFWGIIYNPNIIRKGTKEVKVYHSREEVESILRDRYSEHLGYYTDDKWFALWKAAGIDWARW